MSETTQIRNRQVGEAIVPLIKSICSIQKLGFKGSGAKNFTKTESETGLFLTQGLVSVLPMLDRWGVTSALSYFGFGSMSELLFNPYFGLLLCPHSPKASQRNITLG
ncbi:MAG: hypothetical protein Fur0025_15210 [Oscillatoriaceae cyanobacterium]